MPKRPQALTQYRGSLASEEQTFPSFGARIPHDLSLDSITTPSFWHTQNRTLTPGARIRCEWECGSRSAVLRVMGIDANAKEVLVIVEHDTIFPLPPVPGGFSLEFVNAAIGWRILEEGRRTPLRTGFPTAYAAAKWLRADRGPKDEAAIAPTLPKPSAKPAPAAKGKATEAEQAPA